MRIGLLTGGGDCPGLNAVIRGAVRKGIGAHGHVFTGYRYGWAGVLEGNGFELTLEETKGILPRGGTILGTSRTNPYKEGADGTALVRAAIEHAGVDALIPIGGEDTLGVAGRLAADGVPVVGVPKTIDNDLDGTDYTFGFDTAVQVATDAIDRLHTTAESPQPRARGGGHGPPRRLDRGARRDGGRRRRDPRSRAPVRPRRGLQAPARPPRPRAHVLDRRRQRGRPPARRDASTKTGEVDEFGHERLGGIAAWLEREIEARTGYETRMVVLGHVQRGGTPTAYDRVLATRYGVEAVDALTRGETGVMVALRGTDVMTVPLADALTAPKLLDPALYETAAVFFG